MLSLFRRHPVGATVNDCAARSVRRCQIGEPISPRGHRTIERRGERNRASADVFSGSNRLREGQQREQRVVQFVGVAHVGPRLGAHFRDGRRIEASDFRQHGLGQHAAHFDGARAALFERRIVEIGVGIGVEYFVRELRWHRRVDGDAANAALADRREDFAQAVDVHGLGEHVLHRFAHQRMIGNLDVAHDIFLAGERFGKDRREQIVGAHALNLRRNFLAAC